MAIAYSEIPLSFRTPGTQVEFNASRAAQGPVGVPAKILVIGEMVAAGTGRNLTPYQILSPAQAQGLFGVGSQLASMLSALKAVNRITEVWALALPAITGGVKRVATLTVSGPATGAGTLCLYIGGQLVQVGVAVGDTADEIAAAAVAAINAQSNLPVTAAVGGAGHTSDIVMTLNWKGISGNDLDFRPNYRNEQMPAGVGLGYAATTAGAGVQDLTTVWAVLGDDPYSTIICPYTDAGALAALNTEMERRFGAMVQAEGIAFCAAPGSLSTLITLGTGLNSRQICLMGCGLSPTPSWIWAAILGAVDSYEPDPARPRQTLSLPGILAPAKADILTRDERDMLLHDGVSTFVVDQSGAVTIEREITTYQDAPGGVPDSSYLDVTTMRTLSAIRYTMRAWNALKFPRCKLADDGTKFAPGQPIVTPSSARASYIALFLSWQDNGWVEDVAQFKAEMVVQRNLGDRNRLDALLTPALLGQLIGNAVQVAFLQ